MMHYHYLSAILFVLFNFIPSTLCDSSALIVCSVDGMVYTFDAWSGELRGLFGSGPALVSSSTLSADGGPSCFEEDDCKFGSPSPLPPGFQNPLKEQIIPGLDGHIYTLTYSDNSINLDVLPVSAMDVTQSPVSTCKESRCGIVMGEKRSKVFALDVASGNVKWTSGRMAKQPKVAWKGGSVLLQREDYWVKQVDVDSGEENWNLTVGTFSALDFGVNDEKKEHDLLDGSAKTNRKSLPGTLDKLGEKVKGSIPHSPNFKLLQDHRILSFPSIAFGEDGTTIVAVDSTTGLFLWERRIESVVAAVYGVGRQNRWVPLEVIDISEVLHSSPSPAASPSTAVSFVPFSPSADTTSTPQSQNHIAKLNKHSSTLFVTSVTNSPLPLISPNAALQLPSPTTDTQVHAYKNQHGLFISWRILTLFSSLLTAIALMGRRAYLKQKQLLKSATTPTLIPTNPSSEELNGKFRSHSVDCTVQTDKNGLPPLELSSPALRHIQSNIGVQKSTAPPVRSYSMPSLNSNNDAETALPLTKLPEHKLTQPTTTINGIPLAKYSRYNSEFTELSPLGKGGFGTVFKCLNKIDGREYAIKKVQIKSQTLSRVLREVKILALLDHPNVVRYYTAWLEVEEGDVGKEKKDDCCFSSEMWTGDSFLDDQTKNTAWKKSNGWSKSGWSKSGWSKSRLMQNSTNPLGNFDFNLNDSLLEEEDDEEDQSAWSHDECGNEEDLGFHWERSDSDNPIQSESFFQVPSKKDMPKRNSSFSFNSSKSDSTSNPSSSMHQTTQTPTTASQQTTKKQQRQILYIQMQLCSQKTLADFLATPSARHLENNMVDIPSALKLFAQIAQGVKHVHHRGLIHRDLKPSNCFIDVEGVVKIGDFGLSRESGLKYEEKEETNETVGSLFDDEGANTAGIGTRSYASPEQMNGSDYDASTDVYSLGVMLFELCYPMYTGMERHLVLSNLRSSQIFPPVWHKTVATSFPSIHTLLASMLSPKPSSRLSSLSVSNQIESLLGEYTVQSLDRSITLSQKGSFLLRVEAMDKEGVLRRTIAIIKDAAPSVSILQYGLRGVERKMIMEFALCLIGEEEEEEESSGSDDGEDVDRILEKLEESEEIKLVRRVTDQFVVARRMV